MLPSGFIYQLLSLRHARHAETRKKRDFQRQGDGGRGIILHNENKVLICHVVNKGMQAWRSFKIATKAWGIGDKNLKLLTRIHKSMKKRNESAYEVHHGLTNHNALAIPAALSVF